MTRAAAAQGRRESDARATLDLTHAALRAARPHPGLRVPFCAALLRCQAPTLRGTQCRRVGRWVTKVTHVVRGRRTTREHACCRQHRCRGLRLVGG